VFAPTTTTTSLNTSEGGRSYKVRSSVLSFYYYYF
jgi:hypothetical protein